MRKGPGPGSAEMGRWAKIQDTLKKRVITVDDFPCRLPSPPSQSKSQQQQPKYVGGVDVTSPRKIHPWHVGAWWFWTSFMIYASSIRNIPASNLAFLMSLPGFLAFREAPILVHLLEKMKKDASPFYPQVLMVDGNGLLHPLGFGFASHLGGVADLPTIGIGKNLHHVDVLLNLGLGNFSKLKKTEPMASLL